MAARLIPPSLVASLSSLRIAPSSAIAARSFSTSSTLTSAEKRKAFNPYAAAISKKRKEANLHRQAELSVQRASTAVDPVVGRPTAFIESLETPLPPPPSLDAVLSSSTATPLTQLNHFITPTELPHFLSTSKHLTAPVRSSVDTYIDPELASAHSARHDRAVEAIKRILSLANGSSKDRTRSNTQLCIDTFGRHVTDGALPRDPGVPSAAETAKTPRAGPDTGSSEVQAAILTVKIRTLEQQLHRDDGHQSKDKHNKRNLRLMVHRRQKLLKYLKRKEKGGVRYRNVLDALGLDDAAVMNELFL
ncbi:hypothetical protein BZA05DRAFT_355745 [Tricharina praecox]|uniref:uncharacterized protein n=1 Tax=Tricharina praecox TaxID=43433 RepID=UPI00221F12DD|nr:uncharacterized protein BZA05DRAFT_355745 [Tricharina praecox]KAI5848958.1 hypothetical protein BZA05DRAFT_355745 [Tricharina praecox]